MIDGGAAAMTRSRTSNPSAAKPFTMPAHDGVRLNEDQRRAPIPPDPRQGDPELPVARSEMRTAGRALQRAELLPKRQVFQGQFPMSAEGQRQCAANQYDHLQHAAIVWCVAGGNQPAPMRTEFWRTTGWRRGEIVSLRWDAVDRQAREVRLRTSKNGQGRVLPLDHDLWRLMERRWAGRTIQKKDGTTKLSEFVFHRHGSQGG